MMRSVGVLGLLVLASAPAWAQTSPDATFSPFQDPEARAFQVLDSAQHTVDIAQYNIRNPQFVDELKTLRARGVKIRIVVDAKNAAKPYNTLDDTIQADGFDIVRYLNNSSKYSIMHFKFTVVDQTTVMTGSYNWNETAQLVNDENMVVFHDPALAAAYEREFQAIHDKTAYPAGPGVGTEATTYFSPQDHPRDAIVSAINHASHRVLVAVFAFHSYAVAYALRDAAKRGVKVILVTEKKQADTTHADEIVAQGGPNARVIVAANTSSTYSAMHQKYAVVDDDELFTGACNWTYTAFHYSNEDVVDTRDPGLVRSYIEEFAALVHRYDPAHYDPNDFGVNHTDAVTQFVVQMPDTQPGDTVVVTGDDPALGSWDPAHGLVLQTLSGVFPTWTGRVRLAAGAHVEWKALVRTAAGDVHWELGSNRTLDVDRAGTNGVALAAFRDHVQVSLTATLPASVAATFSASIAATSSATPAPAPAAPAQPATAALPAGASLRLVGQDGALGNWDPAHGLQLSEDPAHPGTYHATVPLLPLATVPCKLVLVAQNGKVEWESGWNRVLDVVGDQATQAVDLGAFQP